MPLTWTLKQWLHTNRGINFEADRPLKHLKELQEILKKQTGSKIALSTLHNLLEKQPKTLDYRILQKICDGFQCQLRDFCAVKPTPRSRPIVNRTDVNIQHLLQPCAIAGNECLRSFIARVEITAITHAVSVTGSLTQAARLLGANRVTLQFKRTRYKYASKQLSTDNAIPLSPSIFTMRENEDFESFTRRIQQAAIETTLTLERSFTRSALRLGYARAGFVQLRTRLGLLV